MRRNTRVLLAITVLAFAALACQAITGGGSDTPPVDVNPPDINVTEPPVINIPPIFGGGDTLLSDDFSSDQWGIGTDTDSSVEYSNETLQFIVFTNNYIVWSWPNEDDYSNIHLEVTAFDNSADPASSFGFFCNMQITDSRYYFAISPDGNYAIIKSSVASDDVVLTNNNEWVVSDLIPQNAASYRIGADCSSDGTLTLYVNDQKIDSVVDTDYTSGRIALFAWSDEQASGTNVSFDDFEITELP